MAKRTEIEKKFIAALKLANPLIQAKLDEAQAAITAAQDLSEEHGVPFSAYIDGGALKNEYVPESFEEKGFDKIEDLYELCEKAGIEAVYGTEGYAGWQQSYC